MSCLNKIAVATLFTTLLVGVAGNAMGETQWNKDHPRRHEVNSRLNNQNRRITKEERNGQISQGQAHQMRKEDRQIRHEERGMAAQNGGHITKGEQRTLNRQENGVSRQIGQ